MKRDPFLAIADPTRRAILMMLAVNAMTPNAVAEHFNSTRQAVSKHMKILCECQLLKPKKQGREIYYHLNGKNMKDLETWLAEFKALWSKRFEQLDELLINIEKK